MIDDHMYAPFLANSKNHRRCYITLSRFTTLSRSHTDRLQPSPDWSEIAAIFRLTQVRICQKTQGVSLKRALDWIHSIPQKTAGSVLVLLLLASVKIFLFYNASRFLTLVPMRNVLRPVFLILAFAFVAHSAPLMPSSSRLETPSAPCLGNLERRTGRIVKGFPPQGKLVEVRFSDAGVMDPTRREFYHEVVSTSPEVSKRVTLTVFGPGNLAEKENWIKWTGPYGSGDSFQVRTYYPGQHPNAGWSEPIEYASTPKDEADITAAFRPVISPELAQELWDAQDHLPTPEKLAKLRSERNHHWFDPDSYKRSPFS
ncbi:hypothetical protein F5878DRAFT_713329 [Lentinula raphanica]|uniref:Uncharacterized protein n=1 Tax=Lentinula raphanica TaxID=153919 RepID=A0AA38UCB2_9AGAR|nr:hypothetical protein F5878DRAFT_713329 [Lentinula raphanica]